MRLPTIHISRPAGRLFFERIPTRCPAYFVARNQRWLGGTMRSAVPTLKPCKTPPVRISELLLTATLSATKVVGSLESDCLPILYESSKIASLLTYPRLRQHEANVLLVFLNLKVCCFVAYKVMHESLISVSNLKMECTFTITALRYWPQVDVRSQSPCQWYSALTFTFRPVLSWEGSQTKQSRTSLMSRSKTVS